MKLSARDKQRLQWGLMALGGGAGLLYAFVQLLIFPLMQVRVEEKAKLEDYQGRIDKARVAQRELAGDSNEVVRLQAYLAVATNRYVVIPVLGSTLVSVQNIVEPIAAACDLQIESYAERGRNELPLKSKDVGVIIERYLMEINVVGSYAAVRDFLQAVETTNACVCVTDVEIVGRSDDPFRHKTRICMEWPVFGERKAVESSAAAAVAKKRKGANP